MKRHVKQKIKHKMKYSTRVSVRQMKEQHNETKHSVKRRKKEICNNDNGRKHDGTLLFTQPSTSAPLPTTALAPAYAPHAMGTTRGTTRRKEADDDGGTAVLRLCMDSVWNTWGSVKTSINCSNDMKATRCDFLIIMCFLLLKLLFNWRAYPLKTISY